VWTPVGHVHSFTGGQGTPRGGGGRLRKPRRRGVMPGNPQSREGG